MFPVPVWDSGFRADRDLVGSRSVEAQDSIAIVLYIGVTYQVFIIFAYHACRLFQQIVIFIGTSIKTENMNSCEIFNYDLLNTVLSSKLT